MESKTSLNTSYYTVSTLEARKCLTYPEILSYKNCLQVKNKQKRMNLNVYLVGDTTSHRHTHTYTVTSGDFRRTALETLLKFSSTQVFSDPSGLEVINLNIWISWDVSLTDFHTFYLLLALFISMFLREDTTSDPNLPLAQVYFWQFYYVYNQN